MSADCLGCRSLTLTVGWRALLMGFVLGVTATAKGQVALFEGNLCPTHLAAYKELAKALGSSLAPRKAT